LAASISVSTFTTHGAIYVGTMVVAPTRSSP
jgi:hypothetical protein